MGNLLLQRLAPVAMTHNREGLVDSQLLGSLRMTNLKYVRNGMACVFLVITAVYLNTAELLAYSCDGPSYVQDGVICEAHYDCEWYANESGEAWESEDPTSGSPECTWFHWTSFDLWMHVNFGSSAWLSNFQCYNVTPPYLGQEGTYGSFTVVSPFEGQCP